MDEPGRTPAEVAAGYDAVAHDYAALEGAEPWPRMRWLRTLLARLPEDSHVLDLGCGNGVPATREIARSHRALGVDISAHQIELAGRNVPEAEFRRGDAATLDFAPESFDAVVSFYMLGHIPRSEHPGLLGRIYGWLRPGGFLLVSVEEDEEPDTTAEWLGVPMFFSAFDADTVIGMIEDSGFRLLSEAAETQLEGELEVPFRWVLAEKPPQPGGAAHQRPI